MYTVTFSFEEKHKLPVSIENLDGDQSLLDIALQNEIDLHHNCGGVCACSTCHIYLEKGEEFVEGLSDKEEDFIDRARNPKLNSRLACQCWLMPGCKGVVNVTIPDQSIIQGE